MSNMKMTTIKSDALLNLTQAFLKYRRLIKGAGIGYKWRPRMAEKIQKARAEMIINNVKLLLADPDLHDWAAWDGPTIYNKTGYRWPDAMFQFHSILRDPARAARMLYWDNWDKETCSIIMTGFSVPGRDPPKFRLKPVGCGFADTWEISMA
jgi:hypothetical protein